MNVHEPEAAGRAAPVPNITPLTGSGQPERNPAEIHPPDCSDERYSTAIHSIGVGDMNDTLTVTLRPLHVLNGVIEPAVMVGPPGAWN